MRKISKIFILRKIFSFFILGLFLSLTASVEAVTVTHTYDSLNRIIKSQYSDGNSSTVLIYKYDDAGNMTLFSTSIDSDSDGLSDAIESASGLDPYDSDTDDDGIPDGSEDKDYNGTVDEGETDPNNSDTDNDGIQDGTELGYTLLDIDNDTYTNIFQPDLDPLSTTDPLYNDSDNDGLLDGQEDVNNNGMVDVGETNPTVSEDSALLVPGDYPSIQSAIDASFNGDTILVSPGTYYENINFNGKGITIGSLFLTTGDISYISQTIIDGSQSGNVVRFENQESESAKLIGFIITNGNGEYGGGIYCYDSSPIISNAIIRANKSVSNGGGICITGALNNSISSPVISDVEITNNIAGGDGGGIAVFHGSNPIISNVIIKNNSGIHGGGIQLQDSSPTITNVLIAKNNATHPTSSYGGGIYCNGSNPTLINSTISDNVASNGGGVHCYADSNPVLENSILWGNLPQEIYFQWTEGTGQPAMTISVSFSDIDGGSESILTDGLHTVEWGEGNIQADPLFGDTSTDDYHLQQGSPCIDTGTATGAPTRDIEGILRPQDTAIDIGAYEFIDTDSDGIPDYNDLCPEDPLKTDPGACDCGTPDTDTDGDGLADCNDLCPSDTLKTDPGICDCGTPDTDTDGDGTVDCNDLCPDDSAKTDPGICGCGVADTDSDNDGTVDCDDECSSDPDKTAPGICGCGVADTDSDNDGTADCDDECSSDPDKTAPGICGCGVADTDSDNDGTADCDDFCPDDPLKTERGCNGCGVVDIDTDKDGQPDCIDEDDDNDGMPDEWEDQYNLDPLVDDSGNDTDGDGFNNILEYMRGTDPKDPKSHQSRPMSWLLLLLEVD